MRKLGIIALSSFLMMSPALAQQQVSPEMMQRLLGAVENQRNQALAASAVAEAKGQALAEDLAKAQARIQELEKKLAPAAQPADK